LSIAAKYSFEKPTALDVAEDIALDASGELLDTSIEAED
jgi:hypothetical protein